MEMASKISARLRRLSEDFPCDAVAAVYDRRIAASVAGVADPGAASSTPATTKKAPAGEPAGAQF